MKYYNIHCSDLLLEILQPEEHYSLKIPHMISLLKPAVCIIVLVTPCMMLNNAIISSSPYVTTPFAIAKRIKIFNACSGLFTSVKLPQVLSTPTTKNKTNKASGEVSCILDYRICVSESESIHECHLHTGWSVCSNLWKSNFPYDMWNKEIHCSLVKICCPIRV